ncbi:MAG: hypothetical protein AB8C84_05515 [Oligoflexales bacterium]
MIRGLHLGDHAYRSILNFFSQAEVFIRSLEQSILEWIQLHFEHSMPTVDGKTITVIDSKKIAKEGKRMPGNKWQYQDSASNAKSEYFTGHMFEALGFLVKVGKTAF